MRRWDRMPAWVESVFAALGFVLIVGFFAVVWTGIKLPDFVKGLAMFAVLAWIVANRWLDQKDPRP